LRVLLGILLALLLRPEIEGAKTGDPPTGAEILTLLKVGVPSEEIGAYLERSKAPLPRILGAERDMMVALGADSRLLDRLEVTSRVTEIERIAAHHTVRTSADGRLRFLAPSDLVRIPAGGPHREEFGRKGTAGRTFLDAERLFLWSVELPEVPEPSRESVLRTILFMLRRRIEAGILPASRPDLAPSFATSGAVGFELRALDRERGSVSVIGMVAELRRPRLLVVSGFSAPLEARRRMADSFSIMLRSLETLPPASGK
jgi:hypothetical protein